MLLVQRGKELGLKMSDEQFNGILANIRKENKLDTEEKFQAALKQEGLTIPGLRKAFEKQMLINRVQQQDVFSRISISEEESRAYYDAHKAEFLTNESVTLRELFVRAATTSPAEGAAAAQAAMTAAREKAEQVRQRVLKDDFGTVAAELSDAASKANGGLIGPLGVDELNPDIQKLLSIDEGRAGLRPAPRGERVSAVQARRPRTADAAILRGRARSDRGGSSTGAASGEVLSTSSGCAGRRSSSGRIATSRQRSSRASPSPRAALVDSGREAEAAAAASKAGSTP